MSVFQCGIFDPLVFDTNCNINGGAKEVKYSRQSYELGKFEYEEKQRLEAQQRENKTELETNEAEIQALEAKRLNDLADQVLQLELLDLFKQQQELLERQRHIEEMLLFWIREEDDLMAILYSLPFMT